MQEKTLRLLLGSQENELVPVTGLRRKVVDLLVARQALKATRRLLRERSASLIERLNVLGGQIAMASVSKNNKYVAFNGRVYMDCFAPMWPGPSFDRFMRAMIRNVVESSDGMVPFIPSLVFSITRKCVYRCEHCYAIHTLGDREVLSAEDLLRIAKGFQDIGVAVLSWEGGEPLLRFEDLLMLIRKTRDRSESLLATTAHGLNSEKAARLREAGLSTAIVSLDHYDPDKHNAFRGNPKSFDMAVNGVRILRENGILPSIAICATRDIVEDDGLYRYLELAKQIGVAFIQILDATPSGNYIGKDVMLSEEQLEKIKRFHIEVNTKRRYRDYPSIQARALLEDDEHFGCCSGNALCYVDSSGNLQGCDLLQIAFGNVLEEGVQPVYERMKAFFPYMSRGRCPAQSLHREIERIHRETGSLPLAHTDCAHILEQIGSRGLPDILAKIRDKRERKRLRDFFRAG